MNEIINAMKERRSIRKFKQDMPSKEELEQIVEAGLFAASGMDKQDPIVLVITNKEVRDRLSEDNRKVGGMPEGMDPFYGGPAVLVVLADKDCFTHLYDGSLMMGNMLLATHSLGLGSIWVHRAKEEFEQEEWKKLLDELGVEGEYEGIGHCVVGYIDGEAPAAAPRKDDRVFWVE